MRTDVIQAVVDLGDFGGMILRQRPVRYRSQPEPVIAVIAMLVTLLMPGARLASSADWPCYRGANKDGRTTDTITSWPPAGIWQTQVGLGYSQIVVSEGRVYTTGWSNGLVYVYCFSETTAGGNPTPLWLRTYPCTAGIYGTGTLSTPTVDGNEIYIYSVDGQLKCFDKVTGDTNWSTVVNVGHPLYGFAGSPLVEGSNVVLNAGGTGIAVDKSSGRTNWTSSGFAGYASPFALTVGAQRTVVIFNGMGVVSGVDPANGNVLWNFGMGEYNSYSGTQDPIIGNGLIWACGGDGGIGGGFKCEAVSPGSGQLTNVVWSNPSMQDIDNCSILYNGYIYCVDGQGLECLDFATGNKMWNSADGAGGVQFNMLTALMLANDELVIVDSVTTNYVDYESDLVVVPATPSGYQELYRANGIVNGTANIWPCPTLANGRLYTRTPEGALAVFNVSNSVPLIGVPPLAWVDQYYPGISNSSSVAGSDTDGDGMTAWQEYLAGTCPTNRDSCFKVAIGFSNGNVVVTYPALKAAGTGYSAETQRCYWVETITDLTHGTWQALPDATNIADVDRIVVYTNNSDTAKNCFYRLRARLQ